MKEKKVLDISKLYYLSHPYTSFGDRKSNLKDAAFVEMHLGIKHKVKIINPIGLIPEGTRDDKAMDKCFNLYKAADAVVFCEGWEKSTGCSIEHSWAMRDGKKVYYFVKGLIYEFQNQFEEGFVE